VCVCVFAWVSPYINSEPADRFSQNSYEY